MFRMITIIMVVTLLGICLIGCSRDFEKRIAAMSSSSPNMEYGNGVFYFCYVGDDFGARLSSFIEQHPNLEVSAMASDDTGPFGHTRGYFVIFKQKAQ